MEVSGRKGAVSMTDSISQSSAEDYDMSCQPCSFEGNNVAAEGYCKTCSEYLCKTCLSVHRKQSLTRNHIILGKDQMPTVKPKTQDVCTRPCNVHFQEIVKFYCKMHDVVGCGDCMVLDHKTCKVDLVGNVSSMVENEDKDVRQQIHQFEKEIEKSKQQINSSEKNVADNYSKVSQDIKKFRGEINKSLDKMEAELVLEATKANQEALDIIKEMSKAIQRLEMELKQLSTEINSNSSERNDLFVSLKQGKSKMSYLKMSHTHVNNKYKIRSFEFERNDALSKLLSGNAPIGVLKMLRAKPKKSSKTRPHQMMQENIMTRKSSYVGKIEIKDATAKIEPKISGIALLSDDELAIADNRQHNIRLIDLHNNEIKNTLSLKTAPFDITRADENLAAVTLPDKQLIKLISSSNGILTEQSDIPVSGECYGICHYSDGFVVSFQRPGKVEMLDSRGNVLRSFVSSDPSGKDLFSKPQYVGICQTSRNIFVSDSSKYEVIALTQEGKTIGVYKESIWPQGLFVLEDGNFLVAMYVGDISVISSECIKQKTIVADKDNLSLKWPWAICYSYEHKKLFVSNENGRYINVYQLQ